MIISPRMPRLVAGAGAVLISLCVIGAPSASAGPAPSGTTIAWTGNGTTTDGTTRSLNTANCDATSTPYLLWVLSSSKATSATITIGATTTDMGKPTLDKKRGYSNFKYVWTPASPIDLTTVLGTVNATYNDGRNRAVLTVSHGCLGNNSPAPTCASKPLNDTLPVTTYTRTGDVVTGTDGIWSPVLNCTNTYAYAWEEKTRETWVSLTSTANSTVSGACADFVRFTVTATNEFGSTAATSTPVGVGSNC